MDIKRKNIHLMPAKKCIVMWAVFKTAQELERWFMKV